MIVRFKASKKISLGTETLFPSSNFINTLEICISVDHASKYRNAHDFSRLLGNIWSQILTVIYANQAGLKAYLQEHI